MERFPARNTSEHKALKEHLFEFYARYSEDPLFIPSYLMDTAFAQLLQKQYHIYTSARDLVDLPESTVSKTNNIWKPVCGRNSNGKYDEQTTTKAEQGKKDRYAPSHSQYEALKKFVLDNPSTIALIKQDFRLPTGWWREVKNKNLDISLNGLEIYCRGNGKDDTEIGTVRGNRAIKRQCGIYYFEIEVLSKSIDNDIAIGFSKQAYNFDRFPGWEPDSWGYHGEDGKLYAGQGLGISYGPKWGSGDIIGCGVDYRNKSLFYTKNGRYLGKAFQKIKNVDLYPIVGMRTAERIEANFGHKPFKFDIKEYVANGKTELLHKIMYPESSTTVFTADIKSSFDFKNMTDEIVMEYLSHSGYDETARLLGRLINTKQEVDQISKHKGNMK
ncbi:concanavalin A-like lectin/glucanase domain-containing protein [Mycotypha africana]|uniref:concanavalin A-like lectin/glucanase domain-containing protein n=1 Tax=Mycotypha africana TaxID=64632 RepID=UPI0023019EAD|nr:concanavalin A-like lectin/glucanase domain-containing protein [Mycotypha africana]KAI8979333.1 concanavalin A-like lectin/glucanase domain-containing protein [Mycotypha africana]